MFLKRLLLLTVIISIAGNLGLDAQQSMTGPVMGAGGMVDMINSEGYHMSGVFGQVAIGRITNVPNDPADTVYQGFWVPNGPSDTTSGLKEDPFGYSQNGNLSNYPNPFSNSTNIKYSLEQSGHVQVKILDMMGTEIMAFDQGFQSEGEYMLTWNAKNKFGDEISSGSYMYELSVNSKMVNSKAGIQNIRNIMLLVK